MIATRNTLCGMGHIRRTSRFVGRIALRPRLWAESSVSFGHEAVARLLPLAFEHSNLRGQYAFFVPDSVMRGEARPLHKPDDPDWYCCRPRHGRSTSR